jgi:glycosyltransferase involved in cell wall biosynthesis
MAQARPASDEREKIGGALDLTVILPVRNGAATIAQQLDALMSSEWDGSWEVLIVDNGSTDATPELVASYVLRDDRVRVTQALDHAGLSYARNVGVAHARGRAVAFCDDDDRVDPKWVAAMGEALREHRVVASHMVYETMSGPAALDGRADFQSKDVERLFGLPVVNGATGWNRALWLELGGNDESMRTTGEDFDMALRAHLEAGVEPYFAEAAVYHCRRRTGFKATFRQARAYGWSHVELYRRFGQGRVDRRRELRRALTTWYWLVKAFPTLRRADARTIWAWRAGQRVGRLEGCIRSRTLWP